MHIYIFKYSSFYQILNKNNIFFERTISSFTFTINVKHSSHIKEEMVDFRFSSSSYNVGIMIENNDSQSEIGTRGKQDVIS